MNQTRRPLEIGNYLISSGMFFGGVFIGDLRYVFFMALAMLIIIPLEPYLAKRFHLKHTPLNLEESIQFNLSEGVPMMLGCLLGSCI